MFAVRPRTISSAVISIKLLTKYRTSFGVTGIISLYYRRLGSVLSSCEQIQTDANRFEQMRTKTKIPKTNLNHINIAIWFSGSYWLKWCLKALVAVLTKSDRIYLLLSMAESAYLFCCTVFIV